MDAVSYTAARADLAKTMDRVCDEHEPILIKRRKAESVVLLSLSDYESLKETLYLLSSRANARRLTEAVQEIEAGQAKRRELVDA